MIAVLIIDDHPIVRAGMRTVLASAPDITVVAEGASGRDALRLMDEHQPDVLVLDINMPGPNGFEVTRRLRAAGLAAPILILTVYDDSETVMRLLEAGATGYILKDEALETLVRAVRAAARGESWLSPAVAGKVVRRAVGAPVPEYPTLTRREMEVLCLLARGLDNAAIAREMVITRRTVQNYVSNLYAKLGVTNRAAAALLAIQRGWVSIPPQEGTSGEP